MIAYILMTIFPRMHDEWFENRKGDQSTKIHKIARQNKI